MHSISVHPEEERSDVSKGYQPWLAQLDADLRQHASNNLWRVEATRLGTGGIIQNIDAKDYLCFHSNDYLGLSTEPEVINACQQAAADYGVGSSGSHLISGHHEQHNLLAAELSAFLGYEACLLFSTGYMANIAALTTFLGAKDSIFQDKLNHASLIDAARFSGARHVRYKHNDVQQLQQSLNKHQQGRTFIVSDGVFSMDGDIAAVPQLSALAAEYNAQLIVDDAHGIGVLGANGKGCIETFTLQQPVDLLIGTFGKAFGLSGAFIAGNKITIEYLRQFARTYIYTTALPVPIAAAARASLAIIQQQPQRREHLRSLIAQFRAGAMELGLAINHSQTPIQNIFINCPQKIMQAAAFLRERSIIVGAIRAPSVAKNTERLRITLSAKHTPEQISQLLHALRAMQETICDDRA